MESFQEELKRLAAERNARLREEARAQTAAISEQRSQAQEEMMRERMARRQLIDTHVKPHEKLIKRRLYELGNVTWGRLSFKGLRSNLYYEKPREVTAIGLQPHGDDTLGFWRNGRARWSGMGFSTAIADEEGVLKRTRKEGTPLDYEYYQVEYPMQEGEGVFILSGGSTFKATGTELDAAFLELFKSGPRKEVNPTRGDQSA